jgi:hypothetical protein
MQKANDTCVLNTQPRIWHRLNNRSVSPVFQWAMPKNLDLLDLIELTARVRLQR